MDIIIKCKTLSFSVPQWRNSYALKQTRKQRRKATSPSNKIDPGQNWVGGPLDLKHGIEKPTNILFEFYCSDEVTFCWKTLSNQVLLNGSTWLQVGLSCPTSGAT